jgi:phosphoserine phosphatase RsbU/P
MDPSECRRSLSAIRILAAALCLGVLYSATGLNAQTKPSPAPATAAQPFDATNLRVPAGLGANGVFIGGDDPAFARADYDDSKWLAADGKRPIHEIFPHSQPEVIWQRIHVKVSPNQTGLAIEAWNVSDAFELYVNGQKLLEAGHFARWGAYTLQARLVARIPDAQIATGNLVIAIRERMEPSWFSQLSSGAFFFAGMLTLGQQTELSDHVVLAVIYGNAFSWLVAFMGIGLSVVAFALFISQRQQKEYLWLALFGGAWSIGLALEITESLRNIPVGFEYLNPLADTLGDFFTVLMMLAFVRRKFTGWLRTYIVSSCVLILSMNWAYVGGVLLPSYTQILYVPFFGIFSVVIPAVLIAHLRRGNREERILLIPVISWGVNNFLHAIITVMQAIPALRKAANHLGQANNIHLGPFVISTGMVTALIGFISLTVIIVQRSTRTSRQQTLLEGEMAAAREIQQIILPEQIETIQGFKVETVYQPAQRVGGDFFQVLPAGEGGLLLVLGDVAGKGLPAAMLVSVLVGAIRAAAEYTFAPATMLANLNERMIGRTKGGFSTALATHIAADGTVTIANAGHLSPYLDGHEIELPGALPLGIVSGTTYETTQFQLASGIRLTFYSDGVVEAKNEKNELFGFERGKAISTQPAAAIVEAAKKFGQDDDITVVTIERVAIGERPSALRSAPILVPS